jgi:plastocyanin
MRLNVSFGPVLAFGCAAAMWSCGAGLSPASPVAPSSSSPAPLKAPSSSLTLGPLHFDDYPGDYPGDYPAPNPDSGSTSDPGPVSMPDPAPDQGSAPVALAVDIVGSVGNNAFTPNPIKASVGNTLVWMNRDHTTHRIVLDDGTVIGDVAPGQSSRPVPLTSKTVSYHCTIHPSMVGRITVAAAEPPTSSSDQSSDQSPDASPSPSPSPSSDTMPDPSPYGDPYDYLMRFFR